MSVSLYCFDFDGTLVDKEHTPAFDPMLAQHLGDARSDGARWVINTGRSLMHTLDGVVGYGLSLAPDFIIAREHEIYTRNHVGRWVDLGDWNERCHRTHRKFYKQHRQVLAEIRAFIEKTDLGWWIEETGDPAGLITHDEKSMSEVMAFVEARRERWPELGWQRNTIYLRFTHCDFDKGSALRELARQLGVPASAIFAAGDNFNDLSMLRRAVAHHLVCPANALPEVKAQVLAEGGRVLSRNASRGMAEALGLIRGLAA